MSNALLNIHLKNKNGNPLANCWRADMAIQMGDGAFLASDDVYPEIIGQLKKRYAEDAWVTDCTDWPLVTDQGGNTITAQVGTEALETCNLVSPALTAEDIYPQLKTTFKNCTVSLINGRLHLSSKDRGPTVTITIGGTATDVLWNQPVPGSGYRIFTHYYQGAWRIGLQPPHGETLNHIECEVPPGSYIVWVRVCHGNNEETSAFQAVARCGDDVCINLLLPHLKTCSAQVLHPLMDLLVNEQLMANDEDRLKVLQGIMKGAQVAKQEVLAQADWRIQEAVDGDKPELEARANATKLLYLMLPEYCV
jgi:hypothetical protein